MATTEEIVFGPHYLKDGPSPPPKPSMGPKEEAPASTEVSSAADEQVVADEVAAEERANPTP